MTKRASVKWNGSPQGGSRSARNGLGPWNKSSCSLFPNQIITSLSQLGFIAFAHANSFSLALSAELKLSRIAIGETMTTSIITLERCGGGWATQKIHLSVCAKIPRLTQGRFIDATIRAKTRCLLSRLLRGNISMDAKLES
jgi:osmotically inducible protein OsmC